MTKMSNILGFNSRQGFSWNSLSQLVHVALALEFEGNTYCVSTSIGVCAHVGFVAVQT